MLYNDNWDTIIKWRPGNIVQGEKIWHFKSRGTQCYYQKPKNQSVNKINKEVRNQINKRKKWW